jgi:proteic killer suppression protein
VADSSQRAAEPGDLPPEEQADRRPMGHAGEERPAPRCTDHRLHRRVHPSGLDQALLAAGARRCPRRRRVNAVSARSHPADRSTALSGLKGERRGQFSIRVNDQWRLCFRFEDGNAYDVEIVDYH